MSNYNNHFASAEKGNLFYNQQPVQIIHDYVFFDLVRVRFVWTNREMVIEKSLLSTMPLSRNSISIKLLGGFAHDSGFH